jgi:hypothetical protein
MINSADLTTLWRAQNYNKSVSGGADARCDLNGDGSVNSADLTILWLAANYNQGEMVVN